MASWSPASAARRKVLGSVAELLEVGAGGEIRHDDSFAKPVVRTGPKEIVS
jgi:hypothetical protein